MPDVQVTNTIAAVVSAAGSIAVAAIAWWQLGAILKQSEARAASLEIDLSNYDHVIRLTQSWKSGKVAHRSGID